MELQDYLSLARRRWFSIVATTLGVIAVAAAITWQMTPQYASSVRLFVATAPQTDADVYAGAQFSLQRVKSYANLISGKEIAARVIDRLGLDESPGALSRQISATAAPDTVILLITAKDPSAERARALATTVAREFIAYVEELETPPGSKNATVKATVVDGASTATEPISPRPVRNLGFAAVLGLLIGLGLAALREMLDTSITSIKDLEEVTGAPAIGVVPFDKGATQKPLISDVDSHSGRAEAFRVLRTNFQFIDPGRQHKVFVISSAHPNEGKSTTAANLAISLAQGGEQVAIVEGDLRRPRITQYLKLEPTVGVTTVLLGAQLDDVIQESHGVAIVGSGVRPPNPAELIKSHGMRDLINALRQRYGIVLIDAPPMLPVTDAALLAAISDGTILVVRHGKTTRDEATATVERIHSVGARVAGVVLSMVPHHRAGNAGAYGYGYGYAPLPGERKATKRRKDRRRKNKELSRSDQPKNDTSPMEWPPREALEEVPPPDRWNDPGEDLTGHDGDLGAGKAQNRRKSR